MIKIEENIPTIETVFEQWQDMLGSDYDAYRNHVYRVVHFCQALFAGDTEDKEKYAIAGCFHDIGIWSNKTFDYLKPSTELSKNYLNKIGKTEWITEIDRMIYFHHKITKYRHTKYPLVEVFRRADWVDITRGKIAFGIPENKVRTILKRFPNKGFHEKLIKLTKAEFRKNPLRPLPMMKW